MKPASFNYHRPDSVEEAIAILAEVAEDNGRILAGGQSLMPMMALRLAQPEHLIDINEIPSLNKLDINAEKIKIGALVRHAHFHDDIVTGPLGGLLKKVSHNIAHYPIRQRGTFCGSVAHADPASEWCMVAATLNATMEIQSLKGTRMLDAESFFQGAMATALEAEEMLTAVHIPLLRSTEQFGFYEFNRRPGDFATAMCLVTLEVENNLISSIRLGIGAAEDIPLRLMEAEALLLGNAATNENIMAAANLAADSITPLTSAQISAPYRRQIVKTVVIRALQQALGKSE
ncbi:MAG: carbon-monoxide dehydrogenase medium subunit [Gammaproteobacteria bacterium]|jgi:aerobic carbon-monoxide dehydrogenase medium subunit